MSFEPSSVDGIFIWNCFVQLPSPATTIEQVTRVLKDRGFLIVRVPDAALEKAA